MEVALYVRVSTSRHSRRRRLSNNWIVCARCGWSAGVALGRRTIYCDDGYSGARLNCPGLDRLRARLRWAALGGTGDRPGSAGPQVCAPGAAG